MSSWLSKMLGSTGLNASPRSNNANREILPLSVFKWIVLKTLVNYLLTINKAIEVRMYKPIIKDVFLELSRLIIIM